MRSNNTKRVETEDLISKMKTQNGSLIEKIPVHEFLWETPSIEIPSIRQHNPKDGTGRFYTTEEADDSPKFNSVTSVLGDDPKKKEGLRQWRKRVGEKEANKISKKASSRGTRIHNLLEKYIRGEINNETTQLSYSDSEILNGAIPSLINNINKIYYLEQALYSKALLLAGTVDGILQWNGTDSILDFKTSLKPKRKEYISDYFLQMTAYSLMYEELTGIKIKQIVCFIMDDEDASEPQVFIEDRAEWIPTLFKRIYDFHSRRGRFTNMPGFPEIFSKNM